MLNLDELRRLFARCDSDEPLETGDPRYVDVDHVPDEGVRPRRYAWVRRIARKFELAKTTPRLVLLTGLPGSGKSTELRRVLAELRDPAGACLFPVLIDAERVIELRNPIDLPELILAILVETERRVMIDLKGLDPSISTRRSPRTPSPPVFGTG